MEFLEAKDFIGPGQAIVYVTESVDGPEEVVYHAIGKVPGREKLKWFGEMNRYPYETTYKGYSLKALGYTIASQSRKLIENQEMDKPFELIVGPKLGCFFSHYPDFSSGERLLYVKELDLVREGMAMSAEDYEIMNKDMFHSSSF